MPIESSLDRMLVGLVFNSPASGCRASREVDVDRVVRGIRCELADRSRTAGSRCRHRAADLHQHEVAIVIAVADEILDGVVTCGITWMVAPR